MQFIESETWMSATLGHTPLPRLLKTLRGTVVRVASSDCYTSNANY